MDKVHNLLSTRPAMASFIQSVISPDYEAGSNPSADAFRAAMVKIRDNVPRVPRPAVQALLNIPVCLMNMGKISEDSAKKAKLTLMQPTVYKTIVWLLYTYTDFQKLTDFSRTYRIENIFPQSKKVFREETLTLMAEDLKNYVRKEGGTSQSNPLHTEQVKLLEKLFRVLLREAHNVRPAVPHADVDGPGGGDKPGGSGNASTDGA